MRGFRHLKTMERISYAVICGAWLYMYFPPMQKLGLINRPETFLMPIAILVVSRAFRWWWIRIFGAIIASFSYIDLYWRVAGDSLFLGVIHVSKLLVAETVGLVHGKPFADPLQTFLFIWVIVCVYWLVAYASHQSRLWLFYNILGIAVLAAVDSNTNVHPNASIVVVSVLCVLILGINQLQTIRSFASTDWHITRRFVGPLLVLLLICTGVTFAVPKQAAAWPNPFGQSTGGGQATVKTIGYQLDNSRLGGSFVTNNDEVLTVISPSPTYLRGQTLSTYTGKGWKLAPLTDRQMLKQTIGVPFANLSVYDFSTLPAKRMMQTIQVQSNTVDTTDLFGGYAVNEVKQLPGSYNNEVTIDMVQGNIRGSKLKSGQSYRIQTLELVQPYDKLAADKISFAEARNSIPNTVRAYDSELPGTLPSDVGDLARQIVQKNHAVTEYQMVTAIQNYLKTNYTYQTTDIPMPGKNQDYVAQFLFDSKRGYCNNFSSAMAVMLRTLGIPTRWVTGYADGTQDFNYSSNTDNKYIVTNDDAHSWVEVYFPNYGFVPFDPTPNFDIPFASAQTSTSSSTTGNTSNTTTAPVPPVKQPPAQPGSSSSQPLNAFGAGITLRQLLGIILALIVVLGIAFILLRRKLSLFLLEWEWKRDPLRALLHAQNMFTRALMRKTGQQASTLRELWPLVRSVGILEHEYRSWVRAFEQVLYGGEHLTDETARGLKVTTMRWLRILHRNAAESRGWRLWR